jgi:hypothetical protein
MDKNNNRICTFNNKCWTSYFNGENKWDNAITLVQRDSVTTKAAENLDELITTVNTNKLAEPIFLSEKLFSKTYNSSTNEYCVKIDKLYLNNNGLYETAHIRKKFGKPVKKKSIFTYLTTQNGYVKKSEYGEIARKYRLSPNALYFLKTIITSQNI